jgi:PAS domain S-box-containing protein
MTSDHTPFPAAPLLDTMKQAVIVANPDRSITLWNAFAEKLYGWTRDEVIGRSIIEVTPAVSHVARAEKIFRSLCAGTNWGGRFTVRSRDGHEFDVFAIAAALMTDAKVTGVIVTSMPISEIATWPGGVDNRDTLTARESEIATLTAAGRATTEIAELLAIAPRTVESHQYNIYQKLGVRSRVELMMLAIRLGVIE